MHVGKPRRLPNVIELAVQTVGHSFTTPSMQWLTGKNSFASFLVFVGLAKIMTLGAIYDATYSDAGRAVAYETAEEKKPAVALEMITLADSPRSVRECPPRNRTYYPCHHSRGGRVGEADREVAVTYGGHVIENGPMGGALGGLVRFACLAADHTSAAPRYLPTGVA